MRKFTFTVQFPTHAVRYTCHAATEEEAQAKAKRWTERAKCRMDSRGVMRTDVSMGLRSPQPN